MARRTHDDAVARECDGATLVFRGFERLWMIDRVAEGPVDDEGAYTGEVVDPGAAGEDPFDAPIEASTSVDGDEASGMTENEQGAFIRRQLRKLGLPDGGCGASMLAEMLADLESFEPAPAAPPPRRRGR